ncbi:MAG: hypothetical protein EOP81_17220 [Variovorax sp.]|nr:MAG: hypothetical protein EOP81_17220 [Variovorax sp.]
MSAKAPAIQRDWFSKSLAGALLGAVLAIGVSGLFNEAARGIALDARAQLAMWLVPPVWFGVLGFVYLFRSGLRAWLWLGLACVTVFALWGGIVALRH